MKVFAIGDLHLSSVTSKPMDVFGQHWQDHWFKISTAWEENISPDDLVLLAGDTSWAMSLEAAAPDLQLIAALPGKKIIIRGNHDYWWSSLSKIKAILPADFQALQNNCIVHEDLIICGTRGWTFPNGDAEDEKIYSRELIRLKLSLDAARPHCEGRKLIALMHFPPFEEQGGHTPITDLLAESGCELAVYGHVHNHYDRYAPRTINGVQYSLVSCDSLQFIPKQIL